MATFANENIDKNGGKTASISYKSCYFPRLDGEVSSEKRILSVNVDVENSIELQAKGFKKAVEIVALAWAILLKLYTGLDEVTYGCHVADIPTESTLKSEISGSIAGMPAFQVKLDENATLKALVELLMHQDLGSSSGYIFGGLGSASSINAEKPQFNTAILVSNSEKLGNRSVVPFILMDLEECHLCLNFQYSLTRLDISLRWWSTEMCTQQALNVARTFDKLVGELLNNPEVKLGELSYISSRDEFSLRDWNQSNLEKTDQCIHEKIHENSIRNGNNEAICAHDGTRTYSELDQQSSLLAAYLFEHYQLKSGDFVALCFPKSLWNVVAMLAVLKAGAAFVPLDFDAPRARLEALIQRVEPKLLLCSSAVLATLPSITPLKMAVNNDTLKTVGSLPKEKQSNIVKSSDSAYMVFTSGTTGYPKGTIVDHGAYCSSASAHGPKMFMDSNSRVLQFAAHTFDASLQEILTTLMFGGTVCIPDEKARLNDTVTIINQMRVNWACLTPSFVNFFTPSDIPGLKTLVLVGEPMSQSHIETWSPHTRLINGYGPSECSVAAVANSEITIKTHPQDIGSALNVNLWIVDPRNHDVLMPIGCIGELLIEGPTLAQGYYNDPLKTAESFIVNPRWCLKFPPVSVIRRMYKTGDLVRQKPDGSLRFIGRKDNQVKVHGQRVELGEIEHHINLDKAIKHALVLLPKDGPFKGRLVSVVSFQEEVGVDQCMGPIEIMPPRSELQALKQRLIDILPTYMVPSTWLAVKFIPRLISGKLDRKRILNWLETMTDESYRQTISILASVSPSTQAAAGTEMEEILRLVWSHVLNLDVHQIGLNQPFLSLGGDSISAMQVVRNSLKKNIRISVQDVLQTRSISELAGRGKIARMSSDCEEVLEEPFELSPIQQLFFQLPQQGQGHFNQSFFLRVMRRIEEAELQQAVVTLIKRHSMLRARFSCPDSEGIIRQRVTESIPTSYRFQSHRILKQAEAIPLIAQSQEALDPVNGPLFAADLFNLNSEEQLVFMVGHHLVIDLVSWRIILEELEELLLHSECTTQAEKPLPFQKWCQVQAAETVRLNIDTVIPLTELTPGNAAFWGMDNEPNLYGEVECQNFEIAANTTTMILTGCHAALRTEPIEILLSALIFSFSQAFPERSVPLLFTEGHGREPGTLDVNLSRTVGWFTTLYPIYVPASSLKDPVDTVRHVKEFHRGVPDNGRPYFASRCLNDAGKKRFSNHWPLEVTFNYLGQYQQLEREGALLKPVDAMAGEARSAGGSSDVGILTPRFGLFEISAVVAQGKLRFSFTFNRKMKHQNRIKDWILGCQESLVTITQQLMQTKPHFTPCDFPLMAISSAALTEVAQNLLPRLGIFNVEEVESIAPCSPIQEGLLISQARNPALYQDHTICEVQSNVGNPVDLQKLLVAWQKVVNRHQTLRTLFINHMGVGDGIYDQIVRTQAAANVVIIQATDEKAALQTLSEGPKFQPANEQLAHRFTVCKTSDSRLFCKLDISHTIIDGESMSLIFRELVLAYQDQLPHGSGPLYSQYIAHIRKIPIESGLEFWKSYLSDLAPCEFPILNDGIVGPEEVQFQRLEFENDKFLRIQKFCELEGFTFCNVLHAAWALTLRCYTGSEDTCFGYLFSERDIPIMGIEDAVGPYINMLACRLKIDPKTHILDLLRQVQEGYIHSLTYHHVSLAQVQHELRLSGSPIFDTSLSFRKVMTKGTDVVPQEVSFHQCCPTYDPTEYAISINIESSETSVAIDLSYWENRISNGQAMNIGSTFLSTLELITCHPYQEVGQLSFLPPISHQQILSWNNEIPLAIEDCIHNVIARQTYLYPNSPAICGWDSSFSYSELDAMSTKLSIYLQKLGAGPEWLIPVCFDKSAWAIVAMLSILKAGAAAVPLDFKHPKIALEKRVSTAGAQIILVAPALAPTFHGMVSHIVPISQGFMDRLPQASMEIPLITEVVNSRNACFVIYTSGSTGEPKGVVLEHRNIVTSAEAHGSKHGTGSNSRVLQFSAYTFDNSLTEIFTTLMRGGCVCVPSEYDRHNNLASSINKMGVNFMNLTPTVATFLHPSEVPQVKGLSLGGEPVTKENVETWANTVALHSVYGPTECSIDSTWNGDLQSSSEPTNLGRSIGSISWITDPSNHNILQPIGAIGELLIEGPILSRGYLKDEEKTARSFILDPNWVEGKGRRMYKTGDLVRYNSNGTLTYVGRCDTQVKLNGQRLELGEIGYHVKIGLPQNTQSAVELVALGGQASKALTTFFSMSSPAINKTETRILEISESLKRVAEHLKQSLMKALPGYMVPSLYIPVSSMPMTASGKIDRRALQVACGKISNEKASCYRLAKKSSRVSSTDMERKLQGLWESLLQLAPGSVMADDDFFSLGGDSVVAMRLITAARLIGITLSVAEIFRNPTLSDIAKSATQNLVDDLGEEAHEPDPEPFSLAPKSQPLFRLLKDSAEQCRVDPEEIEDIYPCSALQEGLMSLSSQQPGAYVAQNTFKLPSTIDIQRLKSAWSKVYEEEAILRTRVVHLKDYGFLQIVVRENINWSELSAGKTLDTNSTNLPFHNGGVLSGFIISGVGTSDPQLIWTAHHAVYDGWCIPLLFAKVEAYYQNTCSLTVPLTIPYSRFIKYLSTIDTKEAESFWRKRFLETTSEPFPPLPFPEYQVKANSATQHSLPISRITGSKITFPSLIRAAWALTLSVYSGNREDVVFGEIMAGRDAPVPGLSTMIGPTLSTIPTRVQPNSETSFSQFLEEIQVQSAEAIPFQYVGLQNIKSLSNDTAVACGFQNILVISSTRKPLSRLCEIVSPGTVSSNFSTYPLVALCDVGEDVQITIQYDSKVISPWLVERLMVQFGFFLQQLNSKQTSTKKLRDDLLILNAKDQATIRQWNAAIPVKVERCIHNLIKAQVESLPESKLAIDSHDGTFTYKELDDISTRLALRIVEKKPACEIIPLCFEKSAWMIVAIMAVLKSGKAFVPLDPTAPIARLREIIRDTRAELIFCSPKHLNICSSTTEGIDTFVINREASGRPLTSDYTLPDVESDSPAYVIFTSGSTGKPKGTIIEHSAFCSSAIAHGPVLQMNHGTRVLQFASYTFDVSIMEILTTLIHGGCICVPDEETRLNNLSAFITAKQVTWAALTPSFAQTMHPVDVPSLQTLVLGGEAMSKYQLNTWETKVHLINAYGPSECSVTTMANPHVSISVDPANIGFATGSRTWIVDPENSDRLAPVGSVGELLIEGPLARGYLNDNDKTTGAFIYNPLWVTDMSNSGVDKRRRFYKTGDLVRYVSDGSMIFSKRKDTQKKVHGQRLELGEIEHFLRNDPLIRHTLAFVPSTGKLSSRLAIVLSLDHQEELQAKQTFSSGAFEVYSQEGVASYVSVLRDRLCERLPAYMIPSVWIVLSKLPLLTSGKLDRRQILGWLENLSDEDYQKLCKVEEVMDLLPTTDIENQLKRIFAETLNLPTEQISLGRSFLHLGGDSISAMQVMSRCRSKKIGATVQNILRSKNIRELALCVTLPQTQNLEKLVVDESFDLSPIQKFFFGHIGAIDVKFNQSTTLKLRHRVEAEIIKRMMDAIVMAHGMLRARFFQEENGSWQQKIISMSSSSYHFTSQNTTAEKLPALLNQSQETMNVCNGPVFAADLLDVGEYQVLSLIAHHLVVDVVSWRIILQDIENMLTMGTFRVPESLAFPIWTKLQGQHTKDTPNELNFGMDDVAVADLGYWGMENIPNDWGQVKSECFSIDAETSTMLLSSCHEALNTEPVDIFIGCILNSLYSTFSDRAQKPVIYNEGHGREPWAGSGLDVSRTTGWFTTICPIYLPSTLPRKPDLIEIIRWVKDLRNRLPDKGRAYFAHRCLTDLGNSKFAGHYPMEISFNYLGRFQQLEKSDGLFQPYLVNGPSDIGANMPRFSLLDISVSVHEKIINFYFNYNLKMKHQDKISQFIAGCRTSLIAASHKLMGHKPEKTLSDFSQLSLSFDGIQKLRDKLPLLGIKSLDDLQDVYPCSPMQHALLVAQIKNPDLYAYSSIFQVTTFDNGDIQVEIFIEAWKMVVKQHTTLRTVFIDGACREGQFGQVVLNSVEPRITEVHSCDDEVFKTLQDQKAPQFSNILPPHRLTICLTDTGRTFCKLEMSHAISDGTSFPILFADLSRAYDAKISQHLGFSPLPAPLYCDYISYITKRADVDVNYWKNYLLGIEPCRFPIISDEFENTRKHRAQLLELSEVSQLRTFCATHGITLSSILQLSWGLLLRLYTGSEEVCFGYLTSGRDAPIDRLQNAAVGTFINMLVCRLNFTEVPQLSQAIQKIQIDFAHGLEHQNCSLADVQHELQLSGNSLFNSAFSFQNRTNPKVIGEQALIFKILETHDPSEYDLSINIEAFEEKLVINLSHWTSIMSQKQAESMLNTFAHVLDQIVTSPNMEQPLKILNLLSENGRSQIMAWNSNIPEPIEKNIQDLILEQGNSKSPDAQAVCSWDEHMTYTQLDELTTNLAFKLVEHGVGPEKYVPICFEKSVWSVVALIGILKAGGAFVPLDPSHPQSRLKHIISDVSACLVLCSPRYLDKFEGIVEKSLSIDRDSVGRFLGSMSTGTLPQVSSTDPALVLFTSGTTGLPKGTIIEHGSFCTGAVNHCKGMHIYSTSRVLQFASLTFDAGIMEILSTLIAGGCVCIPSEYERMNDIPGAMRRMKVNWMFSTPSLARTLSPRSLPTLKCITMGGEAISEADVQKWKGQICLIDGYGPSETTICATANVILDEGGKEVQTKIGNIGRAVAGRAWVVDPKDHDKLMPIGTIGELVIEGRVVARGYLNNEEKTAASFIDCPLWLKDVEPRERVYKTGDLVRYNSDGTLNFIARKDTQIKLNGQRIELAEIEHYVETGLPETTNSAVELVLAGTVQTLAAFYTFRSEAQSEDNRNILLPMSEEVRNIAINLQLALNASTLPTYMIPTLFIPLRKLPLTNNSAKLDRARLRTIIRELSRGQLLPYRLSGGNNKPATNTTMEEKLKYLWKNVLKFEDGRSIGTKDSFFRLGGDSISAMKLAIAARAEGITLTIINIFDNPRLCDMALSCTMTKEKTASEQSRVECFSLLSQEESLDDILDEVADQCSIRKALIQDIYPCSPLQEALITLATREPGAYVVHQVLRLLPGTNIRKLKAAWQRVVDEIDILRSRIVHMKSSKFLQVVLKRQNIIWQVAKSIHEAKLEGTKLPADNGGPLSRYSIITDKSEDGAYFVWSIHHTLYDGWSLPTILNMVEKVYLDSLSVIPKAAYSLFIKYLSQINLQASDNFWRAKLAGASPLQFPQTQKVVVGADKKIKVLNHKMHVLRCEALMDITIASIIRAAWAIILAVYSGSNDVVFGEIVSGRDIPLESISDIMGPAIAIVPTRVQIDRDATVAELLDLVQKNATAMIPHQHSGIQRIKHLDSTTALACDFQNLLVIQPSEGASDSKLWSHFDDGLVQNNFSTYPLMVECQVGSDDIIIDIFYDKDLISTWDIQRILFQLRCVLEQLSSSPASKIGEVQLLSPEDKQLVERWNSKPLLVVDRCMHEVFQDQAIATPDSLALSAWDGELTYQELKESAEQLAEQLIAFGVGPEDFVPICMDKSLWVVVSILAVLLAGAAYIPLDPSSPVSRCEGMIQDVKARFAICSSQHHDKISNVITHAIVVDEDFVASLPHPIDKLRSRARTSDAAYVIFTSGSTGRPKGVVIEHRAMVTSLSAWREKILIGPDSRVFQFGSLAFDASVIEIFCPLMCGGCICIPSEHSRLTNVAAAIDDFKATWTFLTPSLANIIEPANVPTLVTVACGGEPLKAETIDLWATEVTLINLYGPTETSVVAVGNTDVKAGSNPLNIGHAFPGGRAWITDPNDHNRLAPVGCVGELVIEGAILSRGYIGNAQKTFEVFINDPSWVKSCDDQDQSQVSQNSPRRMYKTGDLVKYLEDGSLIFAGRKDHQVKLRGQRIELGEIEHAVARSPHISQVIVIFSKSGPFSNQITAIVSLHKILKGNSESACCNLLHDGAEVQMAHDKVVDIRRDLADLLPVYMIPMTFVVLKHIPLTSAGKLERKMVEIWLQDLDERSHEQIVAMNTEEVYKEDLSYLGPPFRIVQRIISKVLNIDIQEVSPHSSFLGLGGDSITAMQVMAGCRRENIQFTLSEILGSKSIQQLASSCRFEKETIHQDESIEKDFDLSPIQQLFFETQNIDEIGDNHFNQSFLLKVARPRRSEQWKSAMEIILHHHSMLRARFTKIQPGKWQQHILGQIGNSFRFHVHELEDDKNIPALISKSQKLLSITQGPLFSVDIFDHSGNEQLIFLVAHHSVVDMVSWRIILQDLEEILETGSLNTKKPLSFQQWCSMQVEYYQKQLTDACSLTLPFDVPAPDVTYWGMGRKSNLYGDAISFEFTLDESLTKLALGDCNEPLHTEPVEIFLSAISHSFSRIFLDRKTPAIFNENHGRESWDASIDLSRTVGWFTTIYPVYFETDVDNDDVLETVQKMKDSRRLVPENGRPYFAKRFLTDGGKAQFAAHDRPMEILFNYLGRIQQLEHQDSLFQQWDCPGMEHNPALVSDVGPDALRLALVEISAVVIKNQIQFSFMYNRNMQHQSALQKWVHECKNTLEETITRLVGMKSTRQLTLSDLPLLDISYESLKRLNQETLPEAGISPNDVESIYPCAPMQEGMLLSQLRNGLLYQFNAIFEVTNGQSSMEIDAERLAWAWKQVVNRHQALRTLFVNNKQRKDVFSQVVLKNTDIEVIYVDLKEKNAVAQLEAVVQQDKHGPSPSLPHQVVVGKTPSGKVYMKLSMSHAIMDAASLGVIFGDLVEAYDGRPPKLEAPKYSDYIAFLRRRSPEADIKFWKAYLRDFQPCNVPTLAESKDPKKNIHSTALKFDRFTELQVTCKELNVTLASAMQAAWAICLRNYFYSDDICFGYLVSGRDVPVDRAYDTVGPFISMLVCRVVFNSSSKFQEVCENVQRDYLNSLEHQHCSLAQVQHELGKHKESLFNTAVSIQGDSLVEQSKSRSLSFEAITAVDPNEFAISLNIGIARGNEGAVIRYWSGALSAEQGGDIMSVFAKVLDNMIDNPQGQIVRTQLTKDTRQSSLLQSQAWSQNDELRDIVKECVNEILSQILSSGALLQHDITSIPAIINQQMTQPMTMKQPQIECKTIASPLESKEDNTMIIIQKEQKTNHLSSRLLSLWSELLQIPAVTITPDDSFFQLGGDSILAMQLAGAAREEGLSLTVENIFRYPMFSEMLAVIKVPDDVLSSNDSSERFSETGGLEEKHKTTYQNYSLVEATNISTFLQENVCPKIRLFKGGIIDVLPVTDFQALSITGSLLESRWMLNYFFLDGCGILDLKRLKYGFRQLVDAFEILRTVFIPYNGQFFQVILRKLRPSFSVETVENLDDFTAHLQQNDRDNVSKFGESYLRFIVAKLKDSDKHRIFIRISHAQYDGVCLPRILDSLKAAYNGEPILPTPSFSGYVRDAVGKTTDDHYHYWRDLLQGSKMTDIVRRRGPNYSRGVGAPTILTRRVKIISLPGENITHATVIKAAWAVVLARLSADPDIIFGNVISGRNVRVDGVDSIVGPCVNTIPVRVKFESGWTVLDLLHHLQNQQTGNMPYESLGFREIIKHCTDWPDWTNFTTVCQHQNIQTNPEITLGNNAYEFGGIGCQDDFADFTILSSPQSGDDTEISLIFGRSNIGMTEVATEEIFTSLCEMASSFSQNPRTMLPTPAEISALPSQIQDNTTVQAAAMSSKLDALARKDLLAFSDILMRAWRQVLGFQEGFADFDSSFFDLGGDIMGLAQVGEFLSQEGFKLRLEDLVAFPGMMEQLALLAACNKREDEHKIVEGSAEVEENKGVKKIWGFVKGIWKAKQKDQVERPEATLGNIEVAEA